jgi:uroporphyrinogen-III synthase
VPITVTVASPYTTHEVLQTLEGIPLAGKGVALLHFGERSDMIADALKAAGADLFELLLYEWRLPAETGPVERLIDAIIAGEVDAMVFTSKVQVRHLLEVAERTDRASELVRALNSGLVVAAVGPTSAQELESAGIEVDVMPTNPKMGPMVVALGEYIQREG